MATKLIAESLDLTDTYNFSGTVTGAGVSNTPIFHARLSANDTSTATDQTWVLMPINTEATNKMSLMLVSGGI